ncbi:MAG: hypothetical protein K1Y02_10275 [Candidatus Hydrogenedentes bacterium]|nr:hypothetical protein [Candidatus Hydrogenedentota bacterium]
MRRVYVVLMATCTVGVCAFAQAGNYESIEILKPAPLVEFNGGQLKQISGGVEIALHSKDAAGQSMRLGSQDMAFEWPKEGGTSPTSIRMKSKVSVDSPQGKITANNADLDIKGNRLTFSGAVRGSSEQIESFEAEKIVYNLDSGDSDMTNLRARGIRLGDSSGYSRMNIDRAATVKFANGQAKHLGGGVSIVLDSTQEGGKPLKLSASEVGIAWGGNGQPSAIELRGNVRVISPQGDITSERADFSLAKESIDFSGNVKGTSDQIPSFNSDTFSYNIKTGDTTMTNLVAKGLEFPAGDSSTSEQGYSKMDVDKAPEVAMVGGKLASIRGGVDIKLRGEKPEQESLWMQAQSFAFHYVSPDAPSPDRVVLEKDVKVKGPAGNILSDRADLNLSKNLVTFSGNVSGNTSDISQIKAQELDYDLKTGNISMRSFRADELNPHANEKADREQ